MERWWYDSDRGWPNLKTKINPNYIQSSSSYRTVNTLPLYCNETATQCCITATNKMRPAGLCNTSCHLISETRNKNTGSPWFATVCFATIHSTYGCDRGSPPPKKKKTIKTSKMINHKDRMWCEETALPIRDESDPRLQSKPARDQAD